MNPVHVPSGDASALTLHNAPPTHWQAFAVALAIDVIVVVALVVTLLRMTARRACPCDRGEDA